MMAESSTDSGQVRGDRCDQIIDATGLYPQVQTVINAVLFFPVDGRNTIRGIEAVKRRKVCKISENTHERLKKNTAFVNMA